ncbi:DNA-binding SARP family transcriptional activator [Promicromonospora sp. AC04]|nr:DNA-binding SARP family transcriptional activator [Promicromonospora sp. AC04]
MVAEPIRLRLLGWWSLTRDGHYIELGGREQRLTALLALRGPRPRVQLAGTLWPNTTEDRALASLRAAVLRTRRTAPGLLIVQRTIIGISPKATVDVHELDRNLRRVTDVGDRVGHLRRATLTVLECEELLPGWYDDWVLYERERLHQRRLRALEALASRALVCGEFAIALDVARAATEIEPLAETMRAVNIRARLDLGDRAGAIHEYDEYRRLLAHELGILPSAELFALVYHSPIRPRHEPTGPELARGRGLGNPPRGPARPPLTR